MKKPIIVVKSNIDPNLIKKSFTEYSECEEFVTSQDINVNIYTDKSDLNIIVFQNNISLCEYVNIFDILYYNIRNKSTINGWYSTSKKQLRHYLIPDSSNNWGDTVIGVSEESSSHIKVFIPNGSIEEVSSLNQEYTTEPNTQEYEPNLLTSFTYLGNEIN